ncbi:MAG: TIGR04282 family arsenosugar biosynthesis glycosyltransferase, partial [Flavobacteriaceae bacterium]|nr:TIGR04282 family arsenosugar biosynthesis glycosyltransferase [Flavobacteriaceae bacterium]
NKNALIIFTRNPELGKCKTRLATVIGDDAALRIYQMLLKHTAKVTRNTSAHKYVFYTEKIVKDDVWENSIFNRKLQQGGDLGEKMENAFQEIFKLNYQKVIIVGSDLFDLSTNIIEDAFNQLNKHDIVIGPSEDGGYYLLGMKKLHPQLFINKDWSSQNVLTQTLESSEEQTIFLMPTLNDIDTYEDLKSSSYFQEHYKQIDTIKS